MSDTNTSTTYFSIEAQDRQGLWHPWKSGLTSRSAAESELAADIEKMSVFYNEARIQRIDIKTTTSVDTLKQIDIFI